MPYFIRTHVIIWLLVAAVFPIACIFGYSNRVSPRGTLAWLVQNAEDLPITRIFDFRHEQGIDSYWVQLEICCHKYASDGHSILLCMFLQALLFFHVVLSHLLIPH